MECVNELTRYCEVYVDLYIYISLIAKKCLWLGVHVSMIHKGSRLIPPQNLIWLDQTSRSSEVAAALCFMLTWEQHCQTLTHPLVTLVIIIIYYYSFLNEGPVMLSCEELHHIYTYIYIYYVLYISTIYDMIGHLDVCPSQAVTFFPDGLPGDCRTCAHGKSVAGPRNRTWWT